MNKGRNGKESWAVRASGQELWGPRSVGSQYPFFLIPKGHGSEGNTGYKTAAAVLEGPGAGRLPCPGPALIPSLPVGVCFVE